ncbi:flavoprotein [Crassaminicella profunda]|uniref:flavoprotein n=1 Tax=Crassaminicella profunda TaxID=1286698 RepID=UPI001CA680DC|nr:flavoprotein [Crassaminicella profunda]QZY54135.1 flavoprotein [Crassaminicella profunda]
MNFREIVEETIIDVIIKEIAKEVLYRLEKVPKKALVIFTGGSIGFHESIEQLKKLKTDGWKLKVLLSQSAERIYTKELIKNMIGSEMLEIYGESNNKKINGYLDIDKVIFPVLTMNTAAKIALGLADNLVTNIVARSVMKNIPIIAAKNACDPLNQERMSMGMGKGPVEYVNTMKNHLRILESYGIKLVPANELYGVMVEKIKQIIPKKNNSVKKQVVYKRRVLTRAEVVSAFNINKNLIVSTDTIITDAAKDTARSLGVKISI